MIYLHAALMLHSAGKSITADSLKKIAKAAGVVADDSQINALVATLDGVNIEEAIASSPMMAAVPSAAAPAASADSGAAPKKEPKEEKKDDEDLGLDSLFG
ncbi:MAG: 50S ribosomal protein L12 [Candidatus Heimdallarchaeota archaeon LC_3]|nr:MAG: 50S ribosomal protein L12 [Candidatus Heimdallarchaeota archaeon LC_3]